MMLGPNMWHMIQVLVLGGTFALVFSLITWKIFDLLSPYDTWERIDAHGQTGVFAGLVVFGAILGCFLFAAHVLG